MRWHRLQAMARKEVIQIFRDTRSLIIVFLLPAMMTVLFGYGVTLDINHVKTCVLNRDAGRAGWDLVKRFEASVYFDVLHSMDDYDQLARGLEDGRCQYGLVIPEDFSRKSEGAGRASLQAIVDGTDDNTATIAMAYAEAILQTYSADALLARLGQQGQPEPSQPISVETRTWFNEELRSQSFIIPGIIALVMAVVGSFLTSLTVAREWERGTMEQLISTPVAPLEILLGKLIPYFVIGMADTAICAGIGVWWFEVPFRGSALTLFAASALFMVVVLGIGFFLSAAAKTQLAASQASLIATFLPAFLLSGFLFAIEQMPRGIQAITHVVPARYFVTTLKSVFLKGTELAALRYEMIALTIFALLVATLATRSLRKRLS